MSIAVTNRAHFNLTSTWPNLSNTGVPAGTSLTTVNGNFDTTSNGQLIEDLHVIGSIVVNHDDVIIRRCYADMPDVAGNIAPLFVSGSSGASGTLTVEDSKFDGNNRAGSYGTFLDPGVGTPPALTVRRCQFTRLENGVDIWSGFDMQDSIVFDLNPNGADPHTDGLQTGAGTSNVIIGHNVFDLSGPNNGGTNSCIQLNVTTQDNVNWLVENNKLLLHPVTGGYCVRLPLGDATGSNVRFRNNRLKSGSFGYVTPTPPTDHITEWSGNVDDATGAAV